MRNTNIPNQIEFCKNGNCFKAKGEIAEWIAFAASFTIICYGLAAIIKAAK